MAHLCRGTILIRQLAGNPQKLTTTGSADVNHVVDDPKYAATQLVGKYIREKAPVAAAGANAAAAANEKVAYYEEKMTALAEGRLAIAEVTTRVVD
jgi:hypothetical protein